MKRLIRVSIISLLLGGVFVGSAQSGEREDSPPVVAYAVCSDDPDFNCNNNQTENCQFLDMDSDIAWQKDGVRTGDWYGNPTPSSWRSEITPYSGQWYDASVVQQVIVPLGAQDLCINVCRDCFVGNDEYNSRLSVFINDLPIADHASVPPGVSTLQFSIEEYQGYTVDLKIQIEGDINTYAGLFVNWVGFQRVPLNPLPDSRRHHQTP